MTKLESDYKAVQEAIRSQRRLALVLLIAGIIAVIGGCLLGWWLGSL